MTVEEKIQSNLPLTVEEAANYCASFTIRIRRGALRRALRSVFSEVRTKHNYKLVFKLHRQRREDGEGQLLWLIASPPPVVVLLLGGRGLERGVSREHRRRDVGDA